MKENKVIEYINSRIMELSRDIGEAGSYGYESDDEYMDSMFEEIDMLNEVLNMYKSIKEQF